MSKHSPGCKLLFKKSDDEMRPYANMFLIYLASCIDEDIRNPLEKARINDIVLEIIQVNQGDHNLAIALSPHDFAENIESRARFWIMRINMLQKL